MPLALEQFLLTASPDLKAGIVEWFKHTTNEAAVIELLEAVNPTVPSEHE